MKKSKGIFLRSEIINMLLVFAVFVAVVGLMNDIKNTTVYGGGDLRNRVVGARLVSTNKDPYFFDWTEKYSDTLRDPNNIPDFKANRVTVTPGTLQIYSIFSSLSYKTQRYIWTFIQWLLLLSSIYLFTLTTKDINSKKLIWILNLFFIAGSFIWRIHIERGQIYIFYVFLIALSYAFLKMKNIKFNIFISGFIIGYSVVLRPPLLLFAIPFLIRKKWNFIFGKFTGILVGTISTLLYAGLATWKSYFKAMPLHRKLHLGLIELEPKILKEEIIESMDNLGLLARLPISNYSVQSIFYDFFNIRISTFALGFSLILIIALFIFLIYKFRISHNELLFLFGAILLIISEFFVPGPRFSYNNVIWIVPISLVILIYLGDKKYEKK